MTNYDLDPLNTPPWWPGVVALVVLAAIVLSIIFNY
jgi:hypothetical protein